METEFPAEQLHKIFDRFYRVDESRNFQVSGVGLGLAIVKRLADLQHLKINVESQVEFRNHNSDILSCIITPACIKFKRILRITLDWLKESGINLK